MREDQQCGLFDSSKTRLTDGHGRSVDFKNTVVTTSKAVMAPMRPDNSPASSAFCSLSGPFAMPCNKFA